MIQNIKNRKAITDKHILSLIKECLNTTKELNFSIPEKLRFLQCEAKRRAGVACYRDTTIVLSSFIFKENDNAIKSIILHEIGHIIAGPLAKHGPVWKNVVAKMSKKTGIKITRCYDESDLPIHAEEKKKLWRYNFRCTGCGLELHFMKETKFVRTYDEILEYANKPRWTCSCCGGTFEKIK